MAVSLRSRPIISGADRERLENLINQNNKNMQAFIQSKIQSKIKNGKETRTYSDKYRD